MNDDWQREVSETFDRDIESLRKLLTPSVKSGVESIEAYNERRDAFSVLVAALKHSLCLTQDEFAKGKLNPEYATNRQDIGRLLHHLSIAQLALCKYALGTLEAGIDRLLFSEVLCKAELYSVNLPIDDGGLN